MSAASSISRNNEKQKSKKKNPRKNKKTRKFEVSEYMLTM